MGRGRESAEARFLELLRPIEGELEVYCRRLIWDAQDLPDAIQNAVARAYGAFTRYQEGTNFRAWMFKILTNEIFALNRKYGRIAKFEFHLEPEHLEALPALEEAAAYTEWLLSSEALHEALDQEIVAALKTLNETERAVLLLRAIGSFPYREISESLEIPMGSVMGNLARARQKMRKALRHTRKSHQ
jgi:RNA polymerase sigma-70 factor (ECF subfamily)